MKNGITFLVLGLISFVLFASSIFAVPQYTFSFDQQSVRPGTSGKVEVSIVNNEGVGEKDFKVCIIPADASASYLTGSCSTSITYLNSGQSGKVILSFSVTNDAPTPSSLPAYITIDYKYFIILNNWGSASDYKSTYISVSGISIRDEANQKIIQTGTLISSVQNSITNTQTSITNAKNMITTAQQSHKDVSTANKYLSNAQSDLSSSQNSFINSQNGYSQAQSYYTSTSYQNSLDTINKAYSDANTASSYASNANQYALQSQTATTNAGCISGYTLRSGQCIQVICIPYDYQCSSNKQQQCNSDGTAWSDAQICKNGCDNGQCISSQTSNSPTASAQNNQQPYTTGQATAVDQPTGTNIFLILIVVAVIGIGGYMLFNKKISLSRKSETKK